MSAYPTHSSGISICEGAWCEGAREGVEAKGCRVHLGREAMQGRHVWCGGIDLRVSPHHFLCRDTKVMKETKNEKNLLLHQAIGANPHVCADN